jgi:bud site selection protein 20
LLFADQRVDYIQKLDQISQQTEAQAYESLSVLKPVDPELPGDGQYFCAWCARHFVNATVLAEHEKSKTHKKRRKEVLAEGSTLDQELVSEMAVGFSRETKRSRV